MNPQPLLYGQNGNTASANTKIPVRRNNASIRNSQTLPGMSKPAGRRTRAYRVRASTKKQRSSNTACFPAAPLIRINGSMVCTPASNGMMANVDRVSKNSWWFAKFAGPKTFLFEINLLPGIC